MKNKIFLIIGMIIIILGILFVNAYYASQIERTLDADEKAALEKSGIGDINIEITLTCSDIKCLCSGYQEGLIQSYNNILSRENPITCNKYDDKGEVCIEPANPILTEEEMIEVCSDFLTNLVSGYAEDKILLEDKGKDTEINFILNIK